MSAPTDVDPSAPPSPIARHDEVSAEPGVAEPPPHRESLERTLIAVAITTAAVTALSWAMPQKYAATAVGLAFLGATWWLVLRRDEITIRAYGLALGGLLEPVQLSPRRLVRSALTSLAWALALAAIAFPIFAIGYKAYYGLHVPFHLRAPASLLDDVSGQLLVIALPEEAFFRGYLQSALDQTFVPRWRIFGADLGPGWLLSAAIFAVGHFFTSPHPGRLAVFFPALLFGFLRARTRGVGAGVAFHAACNLFSATLARGYGLGP